MLAVSISIWGVFFSKKVTDHFLFEFRIVPHRIHPVCTLMRKGGAFGNEARLRSLNPEFHSSGSGANCRYYRGSVVGMITTNGLQAPVISFLQLRE